MRQLIQDLDFILEHPARSLSAKIGLNAEYLRMFLKMTI